MPVLIGLLVVIILAGAGYAVLRLRGNGSPHAGGSPTSSTTATVSPTSRPSSSSGSPSSSPASPSGSASVPPPTTPAAVVTDYYNAVNAHRYRLAWRLNYSAHSLSSYATYRAGFAGTQSVALTIVSVSGDQVQVRLAATQTDGVVKYYAGTYTVQGGTIVTSSIQPTSG